MLPQATLADHMQAIAVLTDVGKDPEIKETGSNIPARADGPQLENVKIVECLEVISTEGEPEPMTPPEGNIHTQCFLKLLGRISPKPSR